ncbi:MAG: tryptophan synthase subunit alpha [Abitibacteriaceae bacterium]|nr:tryptophan synthase subunit alpha [Abditibacteriaceae bacterium]MBV9868220.1 tryptophan synthase subunit alpha [Abditibacteriaceae bacterium]
MSRLQQTFTSLRANNEKAFIPFVTCGDPDLKTTRELLLAYVEAGADIVEIGIPFTDPLADGPTVQRASERALAAGATMDDALALIANVRTQTEVPLVPMTYINPVYQIGYDRFAARCREVGTDGVIISDLPPEEGQAWVEAGRKHGVDTIFLLAPTSDDRRVETVAHAASGFIYAVARMGVTGARSDVPPEIGDLIDRIRRHSNTPVCAGFGFSSPQQIQKTCRDTAVDGIVVASALIDRIENTPGTSEEKTQAAATFARELRAATRATA